MSSFKIRVIQVFRVETEIVMEVEAESQEHAVERVDLGEVDKPDHFQWKQDWNLLNEEVRPV